MKAKTVRTFVATHVDAQANIFYTAGTHNCGWVHSGVKDKPVIPHDFPSDLIL